MKAKTKTDGCGRRIEGIGNASRALGVTRQHLRHVLAGRRVSNRLMREYLIWRRDHIGA